jgi:2-dehydro-3-deoxy-D-arabinonate dehydratase
MLIVRFTTPDHGAHVGVLTDDGIRRLGTSVADLLGLSLGDLREKLESVSSSPIDPAGVTLLPPVDGHTEVWAAGVTYERSREARVEESTEGDIYTRVYWADRPEVFFKAPAWRVVTDGEPIGIRTDSDVDVPEAELAVVANRHGEIVGYTVCDDVSSRSIEGDNPLYLPQAKVYAGSCALASGIRPAWEVEAPGALGIDVTITRHGETLWAASTSTAAMRRKPPELLAALFDHDQFPAGVVLTTGTGVVPDLSLGLQAGDVVRIAIQEIGTLSNPVVRGKDGFAFLAQRAG